MNTSNVVLDRDKKVLFYSTEERAGLQKAISWLDGIGWLVDGSCEDKEEVNNYLKGMHRTGVSPLPLIPQTSESKPAQVKQKRYTGDDGRDLIDKWAET